MRRQVVAERIVGELAEYFHDVDNPDPDAVTVTREVDPNGNYKIMPKPLKKHRLLKTDLVTDDSEINEDDVVRDENEDIRRRKVRKKRKKKAKKAMIELIYQRIVGSGKNLQIHLGAETPFSGKVSLYDIGLDVNVLKPIQKTSVGSIKKGCIHIKKENFTSNKVSMEIELSSAPSGGLTLVASKENEV